MSSGLRMEPPFSCGTVVSYGSDGMAGNSADDRNIGRRLLEQFVLVERIGGGGMGDVYRAEQPSMGRRAVVKLLHAELSRDPNLAARFNLEARSLAALNHPHVV